MMGCGKSTIGKQLSERLEYQFLDTDQRIEAKEKMTISSIFEKQGEAYFRSAEKQLLSELNCEHTVVATGGGMVELAEFHQLTSSLGKSVYLKYSAASLIQRIGKNQTSRPKYIDEDQFSALFLKRAPIYEKADLTIDAEHLTIEQICDEIMLQLTL